MAPSVHAVGRDGSVSREPGMHVSDFVGQCTEAAAPEAVFDLFRADVQRLGYDRVAFVPVTAAAQQALGLAELAPAAAANVPEAWVRHYMAENYQAFDPVLHSRGTIC
jgi:hypothetical protein